MKVSVILPTYNESGNIIHLITRITENMPLDWDYELIVVDDNSPDHTYEIVREAFKDNPAIVAIRRTSDRGLARSILAGIEKSGGEQILVMDTDFTHDPAEIPKMLHVSRVCDIVSGSRFCAGGNMEDTPHYYSSLIYNWMMRIVLRTQVQDNLGGFFTIRRENLQKLPCGLIFFGYGDYYFRLLHYAQKRRMSIIEIPAVYSVRRKGRSKSNFLKLLYSYTSALIKLRIASAVKDPFRKTEEAACPNTKKSFL